MRRFWSLSIVLQLTGLLLIVSRPIKATPAFARNHGLSCNSCHNPFPRLTETGRKFAANAWAPAEPKDPNKNFQEVGDLELSLLRQLPLALRADFFIDVRSDTSKGDGFSDFKFPWAVKLLSAGRIADDIGYRLNLLLGEAGEFGGITEATLHFNDLFGTPLDLIIGQFQAATPMLNRTLRLTVEDYLIYRFKPGTDASRGSLSDLTTDRGLMLNADFSFGFSLTAMILNGNGQQPADLEKDFDPDRYKNFLLHLAQQLGPVRVGIFGYYGKEDREMEDRLRTNELNIWGPELSLSLGKAELNAQYLQRRDLNPNFDLHNPDKPTFTHGFILEAIAKLMSDPQQLFLVFLFNYVDSNVSSGNSAASGELFTLDQESYSINLTYLMRTNIKLLAEYTFAPLVDGQKLKIHRVILGIVGSW